MSEFLNIDTTQPIGVPAIDIRTRPWKRVTIPFEDAMKGMPIGVIPTIGPEPIIKSCICMRKRDNSTK